MTFRESDSMRSSSTLALPDIASDLTRRHFLAGAGGLLLLGAGCGESGDSAGGEETTSSGTRVVSSRFGDAEISGRPGRVVALDTRSADAALALGVVPVGISRGGTEDDILPWSLDEIGDKQRPDLLHIEGIEEIPVERIAALEPEVILAVHAFDLTAENYETLSQIAPVVHFEEDPLTETWQQGTERIGLALGREEAARELISDTEARLTAAREDNPQFAGKTVNLFNVYPGGIAVINRSSDYSMRLLSALGMELDPEIEELPGEMGRANLSRESIELLDADLLVGSGTEAEALAELEGDPLFERLGAVREGRYVQLSLTEITAIAAPSALSVQWTLEEIVPRLGEAAG